MPKAIALCLDGTWNDPNDKTNVWKFFRNLTGQTVIKAENMTILDRIAVENGEIKQHARYFSGVGTSGGVIDKLLAGATGGDFISRIIRSYVFLSRSYRAGDQIHLIGFSRGAYEARAVAGMVASQGLLDPEAVELTDDLSATTRAISVWQQYRNAGLAQRPSALDQVQRTIREIFGHGSMPPAIPANALVKAPIKAVGVFDTVGALGIPEYAFEKDRVTRIDAFRFADTRLNPLVEHGRHAVSIDDERVDFCPTLWEKRPNVTQVLFPGEHSDVGGGWPEVGLSDGALQWMNAEFRRLGTLRFLDDDANALAANALDAAHASHVRLPWATRPIARRDLSGDFDGIHNSVIKRLRQSVFNGSSSAPYRPNNLPKGLLRSNFTLMPGVIPVEP